MHFVKEGKGTLTIEGHTFHIHKNQCFIVPAGEVSLYAADKKDP
ncbi:AraC family ligand binding domain-containing protein [Lactobacillus helveticus]|nr:AraC family ligand binding domain-containing protein [Lactobacillus helveticus]